MTVHVWTYGTLLHVAWHARRDLIVEHDKRATNHSSLMDSLKEVNLMIQRAARLRAGAPKSRIVNACRTAIKANNTSLILKIIKDGDDQGSKA